MPCQVFGHQLRRRRLPSPVRLTFPLPSFPAPSCSPHPLALTPSRFPLRSPGTRTSWSPPACRSSSASATFMVLVTGNPFWTLSVSTRVVSHPFPLDWPWIRRVRRSPPPSHHGRRRGKSLRLAHAYLLSRRALSCSVDACAHLNSRKRAGFC